MEFEKAFERLEKILETMNSGKTPLEESLKLFEEAEKLIQTCNLRLTGAEQKIEQLLKNKGTLALDAQQNPQVEPFR
jgi:exodeoxyribonuclease VII small subunit